MKNACYFQALEFATDPPLADELSRLWAAVRQLGAESIKNVDGQNSITRLTDDYRKIMPEIKQSIISAQKSMETLEEVRV